MGNRHLPEGIITDIISRLPFDTILDCKLVCRNWRALISDPSFSQMHLSRSLQLLDDNDNGGAAATAKVTFVSQENDENDEETQLYYGEYDENDSHKKLKKINHPRNDFKGLLLLGSCNGLICLICPDYYYSDIYIYNPVTREYIILPRITDTNLIDGGDISMGFGYSCKTNEYKFVRIYNKDPVGQVYVYTLGSGSGSGWRNIGKTNYRFHLSCGVFANGALHWANIADGKIVSFDLVDEEFCLLPSPPCYEGGCYCLFVLGGWVCTVDYQGDSKDTIVVWSLKKKKKQKKKGSNYNMMKEQGDQSLSWSLEFIIPVVGMNPSAYDYVPFFLAKSGQVLMLDIQRRLCRFNLITASAETLVDHATDSRFSTTIIHMNSFVSLKALGEDAKILGSAEEVTDDLT